MATPRNKSSDLPRIVLGLSTTEEGYLLTHMVFPGNTVDLTVFREAVADLRKRCDLRNCDGHGTGNGEQ